ncbi:MAG: hypothetical protein Q9224_004571 [Gallowayella concinna]
MEYNASGDLLASTSSDTPSTIWIHSLESGRALTTLIHHSPIKALHWHPVLPDLLLIHCAIPEPTVHLWRAGWHSPRIQTLPLKAPVGKLKVAWLSCGDEKVRFVLSSNNQSALGQLHYTGEEDPWHAGGDSFARMGPEAMFDEGHSIDLSPVKPEADGLPTNTPTVELTAELGQTTEVQDTFHYRHAKQTAVYTLFHEDLSTASRAMATDPPQIKIAPPPWTCHYEAYVGAFYVSAKSGLPRDLAYEHLEASSAETSEAGVWKGGMVMIQLLRYTSTPVGPYDEMILLPGNFDVPGGHGSHTRITRIYVSQRDTTYNGRKNWNIPKHIARFKYTGDFSAPPFTVQLFPQDPSIDTPFFTASLQHLAFWTPSFPFSSNLLKWIGIPNTLVQPPLPEGDPREVICGTNTWYKVTTSIYSPKTKLVWMDLKQPGKEANEERNNWWPGIKRWHLGLWLQSTQMDLGYPEIVKV